MSRCYKIAIIGSFFLQFKKKYPRAAPERFLFQPFRLRYSHSDRIHNAADTPKKIQLPIPHLPKCTVPPRNEVLPSQLLNFLSAHRFLFHPFSGLQGIFLDINHISHLLPLAKHVIFRYYIAVKKIFTKKSIFFIITKEKEMDTIFNKS